MPSFEDVLKLIELDGGVVFDNSQYKKLGWKFSEPSIEEIEDFNNVSSVNYWSKFLITAYVGASCFRLNEGLREERWVEADEFCQKYKFHLNESLDEVPTHDNQTVWRWLNIPDEGFDFLKKFVGKIIVVPCFLSTSDYKNSGYSTFFEIKTCTNSNGRYVAKIADKLSEGEILFKSNTYFKIDSFDKDTIYMTEVKASDYDLILYENFWDNLIPQSVYEKLNE